MAVEGAGLPPLLHPPPRQPVPPLLRLPGCSLPRGPAEEGQAADGAGGEF